MPWVGLQASCAETEVLEEYLKSLGYTFSRSFEIEVLVSGSWKKFTVYEVQGFTEGIAEILSEAFNCPALESGPHLILGEVSAKLWDEAVKIVEPSGEVHFVAIYTFDGFLDMRIPTAKVKGLKGQIIVKGRVFDLPLTERDLAQISLLDTKVREKLEKAIAVYGAEKILGKDVLEKLRGAERASEERISYDIDAESGVVLCLVNGKLTSMRIPAFAIFLAQKEMYDELRKFVSLLDKEKLNEVKEALKDFYEIYGSTLRAPEKMKEILKEIGAA